MTHYDVKHSTGTKRQKRRARGLRRSWGTCAGGAGSALLGLAARENGSASWSGDYWQRNVVALQAALANTLFTPPQEQHSPTTLVGLILVQAGVQAPLELLPSGFRP